MSADVWIETRDGQQIDDTDAELNITYNLSTMLHEAGFCGWKKLVGSHAKDAGRHVLGVLDGMRSNDDRWRAMNPPNGWGDYDQCLQSRMRAWANYCLSDDVNVGDRIGGWL